MRYEKQCRKRVKIERFGFEALVHRKGRQDWRVWQPKISTEFGRYRSRGHAISAILAHFHALHARDVAEKAKADARMAELQSQIAAMHARLRKFGR